MDGLFRATRFEVDLDRIRDNFLDVRRLLDTVPGAPGTRRVSVAAVVKADAYGHGAAVVGPALMAAGADSLAVATLTEALELRRVLPEAPIHVMGHTPSGLATLAVSKRITLTVSDLSQALAVSDASVASGRRAGIQVKIDTGMNRLGFRMDDDPAGAISEMARMPGIRIEGIFTHLALRDRVSDLAQFEAFSGVMGAARATGLTETEFHVCDSIGMMRYPEFRLDRVRVGAALFGVRPMRVGPEYDAFSFPPPGRLVTEISRIRFLREGEMVSYDDSWKAPAGGTRVATLPIGYADGYPRRFSNKAHVALRGARAPVVGLVCMDQAMVDVGGIPEAREGDEVTLLGGLRVGSDSRDGRGTERVDLLEASGWGGGNRNELIASIGRRVPRAYLRSGATVAVWDRLLAADPPDVPGITENPERSPECP